MKSRRIRYKRKSKTMKRKIKGGTITSGFGIKGINIFSKTSGNKIYNPKTGKWDNQNCYNVLGFKYCTKTKSS
jgi:hypothetical protein